MLSWPLFSFLVPFRCFDCMLSVLPPLYVSKKLRYSFILYPHGLLRQLGIQGNDWTSWAVAIATFRNEHMINIDSLAYKNDGW